MKTDPYPNNMNYLTIIIKLVFVLVLINFLWIFVPDHFIGGISIYNSIVSGRERLPFGEIPESSYNLSLFNIDAMFSSHKISASLDDDNLLIFLIGDSSIWGFLQKPEETLAGLLNEKFDQKNIQVMNLGYPSISILKDAFLIDYAMRFDPDLIIWFTTLEALPTDNQLSIPINANNPGRINALINQYDLDGFVIQPQPISERTFWGQRRNLFDLIRLQIFGFLWDATGIDQEYPDNYRQALRDFPNPTLEFHGLKESQDLADHISLDVINKVINHNPNTDFVLINEPILISSGENSHLQYNFYYPKWAYDSYREIINNFTEINGIKYYDFWDIVPENEFTNSAIHLTANGEIILAEKISLIITQYIGDLNQNAK
jgi:hypothetical protein